MKTRLDRAERYAGDLRNGGQRQARVVVHHEDGAMLRRKPPEGPLERVAIVHGDDRVGRTRTFYWQHAYVRRPAPMTAWPPPPPAFLGGGRPRPANTPPPPPRD